MACKLSDSAPIESSCTFKRFAVSLAKTQFIRIFNNFACNSHNQGAARGNNDKKSPFKLLRPGRNVIAEDQFEPPISDPLTMDSSSTPICTYSASPRPC